MTGLMLGRICDMQQELPKWRATLEHQSKMSLLELAAAAGNVSVKRLKEASKRTTVAVIPVTALSNMTPTFWETVASIIRCLGFKVFITEKADTSGLFEASQRNADVIFMADDLYFLAMNLHRNAIVENADATARGFAAALGAVAGGLRDKQVIVLGGGRVGCSAMNYLKYHGAEVTLYDHESAVLQKYFDSGWQVTNDLNILKRYTYVIDCTDSPHGWIKEEMIHPETWFASPAVPLSLDEEAAAYLEGKVIYDDMLQMGVIVMLAMAC